MGQLGNSVRGRPIGPRPPAPRRARWHRHPWPLPAAWARLSMACRATSNSQQLDALGRRGGFHLGAQGRVDALAMQPGDGGDGILLGCRPRPAVWSTAARRPYRPRRPGHGSPPRGPRLGSCSADRARPAGPPHRPVRPARRAGPPGPPGPAWATALRSGASPRGLSLRREPVPGRRRGRPCPCRQTRSLTDFTRSSSARAGGAIGRAKIRRKARKVDARREMRLMFMASCQIDGSKP